MTAWIISVCGIALLTVLCDVIVPDGNTKKYVRTVIGIVLSFALLSPITQFFDAVSVGSFDFNDDIATQQQFIDGVVDQQNLARLQKVKGVIESVGAKCNSVTLEPNGYVRASVTCDEATLVRIQNALVLVETKIMIAWSNSGG